jgi:hypothetical protein
LRLLLPLNPLGKGIATTHEVGIAALVDASFNLPSQKWQVPMLLTGSLDQLVQVFGVLISNHDVVALPPPVALAR